MLCQSYLLYVQLRRKGEMWVSQGTHATGKTGKLEKKTPVRENTGNLEILPKHRQFGLHKL